MAGTGPAKGRQLAGIWLRRCLVLSAPPRPLQRGSDGLIHLAEILVWANQKVAAAIPQATVTQWDNIWRGIFKNSDALSLQESVTAQITRK